MFGFKFFLNLCVAQNYTTSAIVYVMNDHHQLSSVLLICCAIWVIWMHVYDTRRTEIEVRRRTTCSRMFLRIARNYIRIQKTKISVVFGKNALESELMRWRSWISIVKRKRKIMFLIRCSCCYLRYSDLSSNYIIFS